MQPIARQKRDRWDWQAERVSRRNLGSGEEEKREQGRKRRMRQLARHGVTRKVGHTEER